MMNMGSEEEIIMGSYVSDDLLQPAHQINYNLLLLLPQQQQSHHLIKPFFISSSSPAAAPTGQQQQRREDQDRDREEAIMFSLKKHPSLDLHFPSPSSSLWDVGESIVMGRNGGDNDENRKLQLRVSTAATMKRIKGRKKVREPRFSFKTMSEVDVLDDGYKWRKYGQKIVKNTLHPRSYYRCTQDNCRVKKRVERLAEDPRMVITTYEGRHAHSPSPDNLEETTNQLFFW